MTRLEAFQAARDAYLADPTPERLEAAQAALDTYWRWVCLVVGWQDWMTQLAEMTAEVEAKSESSGL